MILLKHDLLEAELEPVAGPITEHSTIYSSSILLTEYANIIALTYLIMILCGIDLSSIQYSN